MQVRIFRQSRCATQSGRAKVARWVIQPILPSARRPDPIMGWASAGDTSSAIRLNFTTYEQAASFAERQGWGVMVEPVEERIVIPRNYADNFKAWLKEEA